MRYLPLTLCLVWATLATAQPKAREEREAGTARAQAAAVEAPPPPERQKLTLAVDPALLEVLQTLAARFHDEVLDTQVSLEPGGRDQLRRMRERGEPVQGLVTESAHVVAVCDFTTGFAADELVAVVARAKAKKLKDLPTLSQARRVLVATPSGMMGRHTRAVLQKAQEQLGKQVSQLPKHLDEEDANEQGLLRAVLDGKADAAFVYRRAALKAGDKVVILPLPRELRPFLVYRGGRLESAKGSPLVGPFIAVNAFPWAQEIFQKHGMQWELEKLEGAVWSDTEQAAKWDAEEAEKASDSTQAPPPAEE